MMTCYLHLGEMPEDVCNKVEEIVIKEHDDDTGVSKCFHCKEEKRVLYSTECCQSAIKLCEICLSSFTWKYCNPIDAVKKKIGNFSCYNCKKIFTFSDDTPLKDGFTDYLLGEAKFFAKVWLTILDSAKPNALSGREDVLVKIGEWMLRILKDDCPKKLPFINDFVKFKTTKKDYIEKCKKLEGEGKSFEEYIEAEKQKKCRKRTKKVAEEVKPAEKQTEAGMIIDDITKQVEEEAPEVTEEAPKDEVPELTEEPQMEVEETPKEKITKPTKRTYHDISDSEDEDDEPAAKKPVVEAPAVEEPATEVTESDIDKPVCDFSFGDNIFGINEDGIAGCHIADDSDDEAAPEVTKPVEEDDDLDLAAIAMSFGDCLNDI